MHPAAAILHEQVTRGRIPGFQYLHFNADAILFRCEGGMARVAAQVPVDRQTTFNAFSVTKTVTAVAALQLVESGELELDQRAAKYLPRFPYPGEITVRHLLTHTAGIPNPMPLRWTHDEGEHPHFDRDAFFAREFAAHPRLQSAPNTRMCYSNLGYHLLGQIIETVAGMPYEQQVTERILAPIGVTPGELGFARDPARHAAGYHNRRSLTYPLLGFLLDRRRSMAGREGQWQAFRPYVMNGPAYGGLIGTAEGFARYLQALLDPWHPLLNAASTALLFAEHALSDGTPAGMALSWFTGRLGGHDYRDHAGGGGGYYAELRVYPELQRGSVLLSNRTGLKNERLLDQVDGALLETSTATGTRLARRAS